jgi:hypothetical protein
MTYVIDAKTPKGQAGQMLKAVNAEAKAWGAPETAFLIKEKVRRSDNRVVNHWKITWEDGPYEWAVIGGMGGHIWGEEMGYKLYDKRLESTFGFAPHVRFEHYYSFDFTFYADW